MAACVVSVYLKWPLEADMATASQAGPRQNMPGWWNSVCVAGSRPWGSARHSTQQHTHCPLSTNISNSPSLTSQLHLQLIKKNCWPALQKWSVSNLFTVQCSDLFLKDKLEHCKPCILQGLLMEWKESSLSAYLPAYTLKVFLWTVATVPYLHAGTTQASEKVW